MTQPKEVPARRKPWALDNAAFLAFKAGRPWDERAFITAVETAADAKVKPDFVVCPDIVAGGWSSLEHSLRWLPWIRERLAGIYLAVQDGMTLDGVVPHLHGFDGVFVGGTPRGSWPRAGGGLNSLTRWASRATSDGSAVASACGW